MASGFLPQSGARAVEAVTAVLPVRVLLFLAEAAGAVWWYLAPGRRRIVHENLRIAFGTTYDRRTRARIGRRSCQGLVRIFAEVACMRRLLGPRDRTTDKLGYHGDLSLAEADHAVGGGLLVTAHLGNWEIAAEGARRRGVELKSVAREVRDSSLFEAWLTRQRGGADAVIHKTGGTRAVLRTLKEGGVVAVVADQNAGRHGIFVPFFGLEASTFPTPAAMALRVGVPIYFAYCLRRPGLAGFDITVERVPPPDPALDRAAAVRAMTVDLTNRVEKAIRRAPEQYAWVHRRWKTRPPGADRSEPGQPFYARLWPANHPRTGLHES